MCVLAPLCRLAMKGMQAEEAIMRRWRMKSGLIAFCDQAAGARDSLKSQMTADCLCAVFAQY